MKDLAAQLAQALLAQPSTHFEVTFNVDGDTSDQIVVSVVRTRESVRLVEASRQLSESFASSISTTGSRERCGACNGTGKI